MKIPGIRQDLFLATALALSLLTGTCGCAHAPAHAPLPAPDKGAPREQQADPKPAPGAPMAKTVITTDRGDASLREREPASAAGSDLSTFQGDYALVEGKKGKCSPSLSISVEKRGDSQEPQVHVKQGTEFALDLDTGPQPAQAGPDENCERFTEDQLTDNYDRVNGAGRMIAQTGPRWEMRRSYSKKCTGRTTTTFVGFQVWELTPQNTASGKPAVTFHSILGQEYRCEYQKTGSVATN